MFYLETFSKGDNMNYEDTLQPPYMDLVAPHCHAQLPILSAIGKGPKGDKGDKGEPGEVAYTNKPLKVRIMADDHNDQTSTTGSVLLVSTESINCLIDCGLSSDIIRINNFLNKYKITKLDYFIITHFHSDHVGGFDAVKNYINKSTKVFFGLPLTNQNDPSYDSYIAYKESITNYLDSVGIDYRTPTNGETIINGELKITFFNTDPNYENYYIDSWKEAEETKVPAYNNYSLITRFDYCNNSFVSTGDIEVCAQTLNTPDMKKCTILQVPHHNTNINCDIDFFNALNPDIYIYNWYSSFSFGSSSFQIGWLYRYLTQSNNKPLYVNHLKDVNIEAIDGTCVTCDGYYIDCSYGCSDWEITPTVRGVFPLAQYKYENSLALKSLTLSDFAEMSRDISHKVSRAYFTLSSAYYTDAEFAKDIRALFKINSNFNGYINLGIGVIEIMRYDNGGRKNRAIVYEGFDRDDYPVTPARLISDDITKTQGNYSFSTPLDSSSGDLRNNPNNIPAELFYTDYFLVQLNDNAWVPMHRIYNGTYRGFAPGSSGSDNIYGVSITNYTIASCWRRNLSTNVVTDLKIKKFQNPNLE